ncbi:unnamed protein product [Trichogramma brassicae]|uniref:Uncharacterized protein n=1 Tax=Trichogramma brassicae TaxID=86971 RepID=A0A6H5IHG4_9HYME|nr:unnamed protein product [Trichogramma brassicae]
MRRRRPTTTRRLRSATLAVAFESDGTCCTRRGAHPYAPAQYSFSERIMSLSAIALRARLHALGYSNNLDEKIFFFSPLDTPHARTYSSLHDAPHRKSDALDCES